MLLLTTLLSFPLLQELTVFVEKTGELEFSGQMIARPLHRNDAALAESLAPQTLRYIAATDEFILSVPEGMDENSYAAQLARTGDFEYAHPNWICYPLGDPNDPRFSSQWHHDNMESSSGWDLITGDMNQIAAWCDTGVDPNHEDLAANLIPGYNSVDYLEEVNGGDTSDINGHGTHVAGCIGAIGNNGVGLSGVTQGMKLMPFRVSNSSGGGAYMTSILDGARWAAVHGAKTVSASYSGVESASVGTAGTDLKARGALFFYAAGNGGKTWTSFDYADTVVVGASDSGDNLASFSGRGPGIDLVAPGVGVWSTTRYDNYAAWSGTSMATPVANGVAAMIWAANPNLTPDEVQDRLYKSCDDLGTPGNDNTYGWGRVNLRNAIESALNGDMTMTMTSLMAAQVATVSITGADANAPLYLAYSSTGLAVNSSAALGVVFGLDSPSLLRTFPANAVGVASTSMMVPQSLAGQSFWVQTLAMNRASNWMFDTVR